MNAPGLSGSFFRSPEWTAMVSIFMTLLSFPAYSFLGVLENDAAVQQLLPDLVGSREVAVLLRLGAFPDEPLHFSIGHAGLFLRGPQDVEDGVELRQQLQRRPCISGTEFTGIHGRVGIPDELEQCGQRFGCIQVVVQAFAES